MHAVIPKIGTSKSTSDLLQSKYAFGGIEREEKKWNILHFKEKNSGCIF